MRLVLEYYLFFNKELNRERQAFMIAFEIICQ